MSKAKKLIRARFNDVCIKRDNSRCKICCDSKVLEVHHITNRNDMPGGGYVKENGITLCPKHHEDAEAEVYSVEELYAMIYSSYQEALDASNSLIQLV